MTKSGKKRIYQFGILILSLLMVLTMSCRKKPEPPREVLQQAIQQETEMLTKETESQMLFSLLLETDEFIDPQTEVVLGLLENLRLRVRTRSDLEEMLSAVDGQLEVGGMLFNFEMLSTRDLLTLRIPALATLLQEPRLQQGYIVLHLDDLKTTLPPDQTGAVEDLKSLMTNQERNRELTKAMMEKALAALDDEVLEDLGEVNLEIDRQQQRVRQISIQFGEREIRNLAAAFLEMFREEALRDTLYDLEAVTSEGQSREAFDREIDQLITEWEQVMTEVIDEWMNRLDMDQSTIQVIFSLNGDHQIVQTAFTADLLLRPEEGTSLRAILELKSDKTKINEPVTIDIPELTAENSVNLMELMWLLMYAF